MSRTVGIDAGYEFRSDGTWSSWYKSNKINASDTGTYALDGNILRITELTSTGSNGKLKTKNVQLPPIQLDWKDKDHFSMSDEATMHDYARAVQR